jgi:type IX secretion system PorP/SprF family membrane protein
VNLHVNQNSFKILFFLAVLLFYSNIASSQDAHFTQYYQVPSYLNPSLVGNFNGLYKVGVNYRDQWRPALNRPYATFTATGESKFYLGSKKRDPDVAAIGIMFFSDKISGFDLNTSQIALTGSFHKLLDKKTKQYLGIGYQVSIFQKSLNYENLTFGDQFNALDAYTNATLELLPGNVLGFFDMSFGLDYSVSPDPTQDFNLGFAMFHFTSPNISFFKGSDFIDQNLDVNARLDTRYVGHASYSFGTSPKTFVEPRALFMMQDEHRQLVLSSLFKYKNLKTEGRKFYIGPSIRLSNRLQNFNLESIGLISGFDYKGINFGLSYEYNTQDLFNENDGLGTFEFSLNYFGQFENADAFCPTF